MKKTHSEFQYDGRGVPTLHSRFTASNDDIERTKRRVDNLQSQLDDPEFIKKFGKVTINAMLPMDVAGEVFGITSATNMDKHAQSAGTFPEQGDDITGNIKEVVLSKTFKAKFEGMIPAVNFSEREIQNG